MVDRLPDEVWRGEARVRYVIDDGGPLHVQRDRANQCAVTIPPDGVPRAWMFVDCEWSCTKSNENRATIFSEWAKGAAIAEREACAALAESYDGREPIGWGGGPADTANAIAADIRARK